MGYFLMYYAILRAVPSKSIGLMLIILSILALIVILLARTNFSTTKLGYFSFSSFIAVCFLLRLLRRKPVEEPFLTASRLLSLVYFGIALDKLNFSRGHDTTSNFVTIPFFCFSKSKDIKSLISEFQLFIVINRGNSCFTLRYIGVVINVI